MGKGRSLVLPSAVTLSSIVNNLFEQAEGKEIWGIPLEHNANMQITDSLVRYHWWPNEWLSRLLRSNRPVDSICPHLLVGVHVQCACVLK